MITEHPYPELFVAQKKADIDREIDQNKLVREAKKAKFPRQIWVANKMRSGEFRLPNRSRKILENFGVIILISVFVVVVVLVIG